MKNKLIGGVLALLLILSSVTAVFAATFHIDVTGGRAIEDVAGRFNWSFVNVKNPSYSSDSTTKVAGTGWSEGNFINAAGGLAACYYKTVTTSTSESLKIKYPEYLKVGNRLFDVVLEITGIETTASSATCEISKRAPAINYNFEIENGWKPTKQDADTEIGWTYHIYEAGTTNPADLQDLRLGLVDLDKTTYSTGGTSTEAIKLTDFTASNTNTFIQNNTIGRAKENNGTFYGLEVSNEDINVYVKAPSDQSGFYGSRITSGTASILPRFGMMFYFYVLQYNIVYDTDGHGTVDKSLERWLRDENPSGAVDTPDDGYYLDYWTVDTQVTLTDGTVISGGHKITEEQIQNILMRNNITVTAYHAPYLKVDYKWQGDHPTKTVPDGKDDIKSGDEYDVDQTYKPGDTVKEPKDGQPGTWTFNGWDKESPLTINENTTIYGTWTFTPEYKVTYEWTGPHPNKDVPEGQEEIAPGSNYDVDTTYKPGDTVREPKDGVSGTWTFIGWDKEGTLEINEDTVIKGTWEFKADHNVTYEWEGPHPDKEVPEGQENIPHGDEYTVDTTYTPGQTEKGTKDGQKGTWTFEGWDKNGTLEIVEDVVIKGTWSFVPEYDITTDVVNGTITEDESDIPEGQNRVVSYTPNDGYQLVSVTVDGDPVDIKEYPASVTFNDIHADHDVKVVYEKIPAIEIEKTADKDVFNAGDTVTYTITVRQTVDGAEARNVTVKDVLPEGLTLNKDSFSGDVSVVKAEDNEYELTIASVSSEVTYTYTAVTSVDADAEELINVAEATAENVPGDPVSDDAKVKSLTPKPEITKVVSNENPTEGEEITYTISVKEPQDGVVLRNAVMTDPIPAGIVPTGDITVDGDGAEATIDGNMLRLTVPELAGEVVVSFKATVTATEGSVDNVATLKGDNVSPVSDNAVINVKEPEPRLIKSVSKEKASVGDIVTYTIVASSDIPLKNAVITDTPPKGVEVDMNSINIEGSKGEVTAKSSIVPGEEESFSFSISFEELTEATITYQAKVLEEGEHVNVATLTADNFPKGPLEDDAKVRAIIPKAILQKTVSEDEVMVGDEVDYEITAKAEEGTIYDAVIEDTLPSGMKVDADSVDVSVEGAEVEITNAKIIVKLPKLTLDGVVITYTAEATKAGEHVNTVTLTGSNLPEPLEAEALVTAEKEPIFHKEPSNSSSKSGPKTGDATPIALAVIAFGAAALATGTIVYKRKKKGTENETE